MDAEPCEVGKGSRIGPVIRLLLVAGLPVACAWARRQEAVILKKGVALSNAQMRTAQAIGVAQPELVRLLQVEVVPPRNRFMQRTGRRLGIVSDATIGMTLWHGIFIQSAHWHDRRLLIHELAHVAQYERLGGFRGFLSAYFQECVHPGYPHGPLEREAQKAEVNYR